MALNTKNAIADSVFLLLNNNNINSITVKEISINANISRKTFYNNFHNIIDVIDYKLDNIIKDIIKIYKLNIIRKKDYNTLLVELYNYSYKNKIYFNAIKKELFLKFKIKLDNAFLNITTNKYLYISISGSFFNIIFYCLENNTDIKNFIIK